VLDAKFKILFSMAAIIILLADCRCVKKKTSVIKSVLWDIPVGSTGVFNQLDQEKLSTLVKRNIDLNPYFSFDADEFSGLVLRFSFVPSFEANKKAGIILAATLINHNGSKINRAFVDVDMRDGVMSGADLDAALAKMFNNLHQSREGLSSDSEKYIEKIKAKLRGAHVEDSELLKAIAVLADAQEKKALMPLIELLSLTNDIAIGNACLIALSELKASKAMPAIIDFVEGKPPIIRRQGIIAARRIASKLAAGWLLVMAYGHDDETVRKEAREALKEVDQKLKR
jgi:hypothetical protein